MDTLNHPIHACMEVIYENCKSVEFEKFPINVLTCSYDGLEVRVQCAHTPHNNLCKRVMI